MTLSLSPSLLEGMLFTEVGRYAVVIVAVMTASQVLLDLKEKIFSRFFEIMLAH